jgi:hypothetical protein
MLVVRRAARRSEEPERYIPGVLSATRKLAPRCNTLHLSIVDDGVDFDVGGAFGACAPFFRDDPESS